MVSNWFHIEGYWISSSEGNLQRIKTLTSEGDRLFQPFYDYSRLLNVTVATESVSITHEISEADLQEERFVESFTMAQDLSNAVKDEQ